MQRTPEPDEMRERILLLVLSLVAHFLAILHSKPKGDDECVGHISRLIAPIAAKQGAQSRLNTRKEIAARGGRSAESAAQISEPFSATSAAP